MNTTKRWKSPVDVEPGVVRRLRQETRQGEEICTLLARRGVRDVDEARRFLAPAMEHLHDPLLMKGVAEIAERLARAVEGKERIGIHGDYDVDGLTSTALYTRVLRDLGVDVEPFVPHRMVDGYGVAVRALETFAERGIRLVLTCDTGFSASEEVRRGVDELGLEILLTDHHLPPNVLPKAHVMVNPQQEGCEYPWKSLCGAGVAYKVLQALVARLDLDEAEVLHKYMDLVGLGTICDVVPLQGENRVFAFLGIAAARTTRNPGLKALLDLAEVKPAEINEHTFGWVIGPRLNAAGRIDDAAKGLELLVSDDPVRIRALATEISALNTERRDLTKRIEEDAIRRIEAMDLDDVYGIVLFGRPGGTPPWHHGVIGIVASWLVGRYGRPVFLLAWDEESQCWKGSGRAPKVGAVNLHAILSACEAHLAKFGGHELAAGASLAGTSETDMAAFAEAFNDAARTQMSPEDRIPLVRSDICLSLSAITDPFHDLLRRFAPYGEMNPKVTMVARDVSVLGYRRFGRGTKRHVELQVEADGVRLPAIGWGYAEDRPEILAHAFPARADLLFNLERNVFRGKAQSQLILRDVRIHPADESANGASYADEPGPAVPAEDAPFAPHNLFAAGRG